MLHCFGLRAPNPKEAPTKNKNKLHLTPDTRQPKTERASGTTVDAPSVPHISRSFRSTRLQTQQPPTTAFWTIARRCWTWLKKQSTWDRGSVARKKTLSVHRISMAKTRNQVIPPQTLACLALVCLHLLESAGQTRTILPVVKSIPFKTYREKLKQIHFSKWNWAALTCSAKSE